MLASFRAELLKLRKRPATWVLALVWVAVVILLGYVLIYSIASLPMEDLPREQRAQQEAVNEDLLRGLLPENLARNVSGLYGTGGTLALILGALALGSEYGWGTLNTSLTQRPGRLGVLSGKALALALFLFLFVLLGLLAGAAGGYGVALIEDAAVEWPAAGELARLAGAGFLTFCAWGFLGFFLAALFKGTALAIGLGLAWSLAVESTLTLLPIQNDAYEAFRKFLLGENTGALADAFGSAPEGFGVPEPLVEPERAALTLAAYAVVFLLVSALILRRRDVT